MDQKKNNKNPALAFCGIMTAISAVLAMLINVLPFNTVFLLALMSLVVCIVTQKSGIFYAFGTVLATSLIMFIVTWQYAALAEYILIFGTFPIIKYLIENKNFAVSIERIIKTVHFAFVSVIFILITVYVFGGAQFWGEWFSKSSIMPYILIIALVILLWIYDIALTRIIYIYNRKFSGRF